MARILVLGGYGGFGARISLRLAAMGHEILVAGRRVERARSFCAAHPGLEPVMVDRDVGLGPVLARLRPALLVDAAGPFQSLDYRVPRACIAAGIAYLDIADARAFVAGIGVLDAEARAAGVTVISGASSVPALSGAAVRALAEGMTHVTAVEMAISASSRATAGTSVATAILRYLGQPIRLWRGQGWFTGHGWQEMRRACFDVHGVPPLRNRLVALADVPDLDLLPARLPGRPAVVFRAGAELAFQNIVLWLASWPVRWRLLGPAARFASRAKSLQRMTAWLGGDRSAMQIRLFGVTQGGLRVKRQWTLIADRGDGPEIPALAVPILAGRLLAGRLAPGAVDAGECVDLAAFGPAFATLAVRHACRETLQPPSLYARVMGARFDTLPQSLRAIHSVLRDGGAHGRAVVTRGRNPLARCVAALVGFPEQGDHDLHVHFSERGGRETWERCFSGRRFRSHLSERRGRLVERFGPLHFAFDLPSDARGLAMVMRGWSLGPLPLPRFLAPRTHAREWNEGGRFHFDVPIGLPLIGLVVHYRGWLIVRPDPRPIQVSQSSGVQVAATA